MLLALKVEQKIWFWEEGNHGVEITDMSMYESKVNYIHLNPVRNGLAVNVENYILSSANDFKESKKRILTLNNING